jgi:hypothetical protein
LPPFLPRGAPDVTHADDQDECSNWNPANVMLRISMVCPLLRQGVYHTQPAAPLGPIHNCTARLRPEGAG